MSLEAQATSRGTAVYVFSNKKGGPRGYAGRAVAKALRRSGLTDCTILNEIAQKSGSGIRIQESSIPVQSDVHGACEILGLDPLYVANEGKLLAFVSPSDAERFCARCESTRLDEMPSLSARL